MDSPKNIRADATAPLGGRIALSADEVAEALGISRAHVWKLASTGRLPKPVHLGRAVRWPRKDLEAWLAAGAPSRDRWEADQEHGRRKI
jgi:excisionase family DNA binding protein